MSNWLVELPKAELHVHLEGAISPETICQWHPGRTPAEVSSYFRPSNFTEFIDSYRYVAQSLETPAHFADAVRRLAGELLAQGIHYAEVTLSAGVILWRGLDLAEIYDALWSACQNLPVKIRWVLDSIRHFGIDAAWPVVQFAASRRHQGVVAFGIGGDEQRGPVRDFAGLFQFAARNGLKLVPHAGETVGPESIWGSLELGANRIGHGFRAIEDPLLVAYLRDHQIPLEICLTSNLRLGLVESVAAHPVRRLFDAGVPITLNTDDPALFQTTLTNEYRLAATELGFTETELRQIAANSLRFSFDPAMPML